MTLRQKTGDDWDDVFHALADGKRRRLLLALWNRGPDAGMVPVRDLRAFDSEHGRLDLRHGHLPMLEERGYVRWDRERNAVGRGPRFADVVPAVEWLRERLALGGSV